MALTLPSDCPNFSGVRDCWPSHLAWAGSLWTSMMRPSAPAATAARARGSTIPVHPRGVRGVHDDGQVAHLLDGGDGGHVQRVAGVGLEGADAPLAEITFSLPSLMIYSADMIHSS